MGVQSDIAWAYRAWLNAIQAREYGWFEQNLADDFRCVAHPFPGFDLDKASFIEADRKIERLDAEVIEVTAHEVGELVLSVLVLRVNGATHVGDMGADLPTGEQLDAFVEGETVAYASAWRRGADRWLCFSHNLIGTVGSTPTQPGHSR